MDKQHEKKIEDIAKDIERLNESAQKLALRKKAWDALDNAIGTVKLSHDMYASAKHHLIDEAVTYLEAIGKSSSGKSAQPYHPTFLIHFAIAIRAMHMSPQAAQDLYKELGLDFIKRYY